MKKSKFAIIAEIKSLKEIASRSVLLENVIIWYWFLFWLANGVDKFLNGRDLIVFSWYGKDRTEQLGSYFNLINLPEEWIDLILHTIGSWEIVISLFFLSGLIYIAQRGRKQNFWRIGRWGFFLTALTFISFSVFDIIAGDRFELLEHNVYIGMTILSWFIFIYRRDRMIEK